MSETTETHFSGKVAQKGIIRKGDQVLITRDIGDIDTWELPGGRLNIDELPAEGLARELTEELGVNFIIGNVVYSEQFFHTRDQANSLLLVYEVLLEDESKPFVFGPDEIAEVKWITEAELTNQKLFDCFQRSLSYYFSKHL